MMRFFLISLTFLIISSVSFAQNTTSPFLDKVAFENLRRAAEEGDPLAQAGLAALYDRGEAVEKNYQEAAKWWRKSAEQGSSMSAFILATYYRHGKGVELNITESAKWYQRAAVGGNRAAQAAIGNFFMMALGSLKAMRRQFFGGH